jgi:tRNA-dihydrouridine synthase B
MAGLSDVPFRTLAWRMGVGYMVSEMVSSKPELWETGKSRLRRVPVAGARPVAVQLAGTEPAVMAKAARRHVDDGVQIIDINFGCPAKKVCRKAAGSALLGDLDLLARIVDGVANAVDVPVTVKTRTGLVPGDNLGVQAALKAAANGAQMIVMHGRSRACKFKGAVDYTPVRRLVDELGGAGVPVLVNGDIHSRQDAQRALSQSGAAGVMVGRAAIGQPWLFAELSGKPVPGQAERWQLILQHVQSMHEFYGAQAAVGIVRKHVMAYLQHMGYPQVTPQFMQLRCAASQVAWLQHLAGADLGNCEFESSKITAALQAA